MSDLTNSGRNIELFAFDIFIAILKIEKVAAKFKKSQDLLHSFTDWDSVIREFEIIGEASKHLLKSDHLDKSYQKVVDFRNQITHEYFGIDEEIVWMIIHKELRPFKEAILSLIENIEPGLKYELIDSYIQDNEYLDFIVMQLESLKSSKSKFRSSKISSC